MPENSDALQQLAALALEKSHSVAVKAAAQKVAAGKPLTKREETILSRAASGREPEASPANYAPTWDELAKALNVTRRAIQEWRKDPRYAAHCPADRADGRHDVGAWLQFMIAHGLKGADKFFNAGPDPDDEDDGEGEIIRPPRIAGTQAEWQKAILHEKHEKERLFRYNKEGLLLEAPELEVCLGAFLAAIQTKLAQFPPRVARYLRNLNDESEIEENLRREMDADLADIQSGEYLEQSLDEILDSLPFDAETEQLLRSVTFDGQDRALLLQLVRYVTLQLLRQLGAKRLAAVQNQKSEDDVILSDEDTGQITEEAAENAAHERHASASIQPKPSKPTRRRKPIPAPAPGEVEGRIHAAAKTPRKR